MVLIMYNFFCIFLSLFYYQRLSEVYSLLILQTYYNDSYSQKKLNKINLVNYEFLQEKIQRSLQTHYLDQFLANNCVFINSVNKTKQYSRIDVCLLDHQNRHFIIPFYIYDPYRSSNTNNCCVYCIFSLFIISVFS